MGRTQRKRGQRRRSLLALNGDTEPKGEALEDLGPLLASLYRYMHEQGWTNEDKLSIRHFPRSGRGLCSKSRKFQSGDALMRLPLRCLITNATIEEDAEFKALFVIENFHKDSRLPFQALLAFYLLYHQHLGVESPYAAYIQMLPREFTTPYFCTTQELHCLPDALLESIVAQNSQVRESFRVLRSVFKIAHCPCCGKAYFDEIFTLGEFKWSYFVVNTRSVFVHSRRGLVTPTQPFFKDLIIDEPNMALAPLLDFFNHTDSVETAGELGRSSATGEMEYVLTLERVQRPVRPYQEIFIAYGGSMTNHKLMVEYGFFLPHNSHDVFTFSLTDIEHMIRHEKTLDERSFHRNKFKFIRDHGLDEQMFVHPSEGVSHNLHVALHLIFKEPSHYTNVLNQVAYGSVDQLCEVDDEVKLLIEYKIKEYGIFVRDLDKLPQLSGSARMAKDYMGECVRFLEECLTDNF